jgi:hypothetical protein
MRWAGWPSAWAVGRVTLARLVSTAAAQDEDTL